MRGAQDGSTKRPIIDGLSDLADGLMHLWVRGLSIWNRVKINRGGVVGGWAQAGWWMDRWGVGVTDGWLAAWLGSCWCLFSRVFVLRESYSEGRKSILNYDNTSVSAPEGAGGSWWWLCPKKWHLETLERLLIQLITNAWQCPKTFLHPLPYTRALAWHIWSLQSHILARV